jgi:long-subunit fatty acid transport protein
VRHSYILCVVSACAIFCLPFAARAGSFVLNEQSVSGLGLSFAGGAAQAEDASTLFFNPAGVVLLEQGELQLGANLIAPYDQFRNEGSRYNLPGTPFEELRSSETMAATAAASTSFRTSTSRSRSSAGRATAT